MSADDTPITIANMALSEIGTRSTISAFDDGSQEGTQAGLWYDTMRRRLLRTAPWAFCRRQVVLTQLGNFTNLTSPYPWGFSYAYPADCVKFRYVLPPPLLPAANVPNPPPIVGIPLPFPFVGPSRSCRFLVMSQLDANGNAETILASNVFAAIGVYNADIIDPARFDELFLGALVSSLASKLVIPLSGNVGMKADFERLADTAILNARTADSNESITTSDSPVDWIETRGAGGYGNFGIYGDQNIGANWGNWNCSWDSMGWSS